MSKKVSVKAVKNNAVKNAKPAARKSVWSNVKKGMTLNFRCYRCNKAIAAKVVKVAAASKGNKALHAYAVCKCGANASHPVH